MKSRHQPRGLQDAAGHLESSFSRLIGIRRRPDRHALAAPAGSAQLGDQAVAIGVLHIDRPLECRAIVEPEELVSVAGEAVTAGHLAAAVWIDGPAEGHRPCVELVHEVLGTKLVILNAASLVKRAAESLGHAGRGNTRLHHGIRPHRHVLSVAVERKARGNGSPGSFSTCLPAPPSAAASTRPWPTVAARAASPRPLRLWPRLVDDEVSVPEEPTVQHLHCLASLFLGRHLDEPESARPTGELVSDDSDCFDGSGLLEELAKVLLGGLEREVSYEQLCGHRTTS